MRKQSGMKPLSDDILEKVAGGSTKAYLAAVDLMNGKYGTGDACVKSLTDEGLDYWSVQHMANALAQGYGQNHAAHDQGVPVPVGMEEALQVGQAEPHRGA